MPVSNSVIRFIKLKKFFDLFVGRKRLDCNAESLLEKIMLNWDEGLKISTDDLIFSSSEIASQSVLRKHLADLVAFGFIQATADQFDPAIEIHVPTKKTIQYYEDLAKYLEKCFESGEADPENPEALLVNPEIMSQAYINAQSEALSAYSRAVKQIDPQKNTQALASDICKAITSTDFYICACIGFAKLDSQGMIEVIASEGKAKEYGQNLLLSWDPRSEFGTGPTGVAIRTGQAVAVSDIDMAINFGPWIERARGFGIHSTLSVPLFWQKKPIGVLILYSSSRNAFGPVKIHLFEKLASQIVDAINSKN